MNIEAAVQNVKSDFVEEQLSRRAPFGKKVFWKSGVWKRALWKIGLRKSGPLGPRQGASASGFSPCGRFSNLNCKKKPRHKPGPIPNEIRLR
jgi:hypothetical protein